MFPKGYLLIPHQEGLPGRKSLPRKFPLLHTPDYPPGGAPATRKAIPEEHIFQQGRLQIPNRSVRQISDRQIREQSGHQIPEEPGGHIPEHPDHHIPEYPAH
jgi:hypothetical protein